MREGWCARKRGDREFGERVVSARAAVRVAAVSVGARYHHHHPLLLEVLRAVLLIAFAHAYVHTCAMIVIAVVEEGEGACD